MPEIHKIQVPFKIKRASNLIHLSMVAYFTYVVLLEFLTEEHTFLGHGFGTFAIGILIVGVMVLLAFQIGSGHNWARIAFTALFAVNVFGMVPAILHGFELGPLLGITATAMYGLQLFAIVLLFSRDNTHYYRTKREQFNEE